MLKNRNAFTLLVVGVFLDYQSKLFIQHSDFDIKWPFFKIVHAWNKGISWGFFSHGGWILRWFLLVLTLAFIGVLSTWYMWSDRSLERIGLLLMISGALGNWLDRVMHGAVFDFLSFYYGSWHFPAFNLADILISIGFLIVMKESLTCIVSRKK
jgi:signal peptidase II